MLTLADVNVTFLLLIFESQFHILAYFNVVFPSPYISHTSYITTAEDAVRLLK